MRGSPYIDTRREWVKWIAPGILGVCMVLAFVAAGPVLSGVVLIAALSGHAEGYAVALRMRRRGE